MSRAVYNVVTRHGYEEDPVVVHSRSLEVFSRSGCDGK
jgi:hypothetical protein